MEISIGKHTLESLTSGMYISPLVLFREYIQNSIDSVDDAIDKELITLEESNVVIELDKENDRIMIFDNGYGIPQNQAQKRLLDIGNSEKSQIDRRGFRGIGRLVGLSYSAKLIFETSFHGEAIATKIIFDSEMLKKLLIPGEFEEYDLKNVLEKVTSKENTKAQVNDHYFKVILEGVTQHDKVLNKELVKNYISQTAPVPYSDGLFSYGEEIKKLFTNSRQALQEYPIFIKYKGEDEEQVFKLNRDSYLADRQRKSWDKISNIKTHKVTNKKGEIIAIAWYGESSFLGTILSNDIKGLRIRKNNILIGDERTLNSKFKEDRFNGWLQGEVFILDPNIIPNARRDDFELNDAYLELSHGLENLGLELSKVIRELSAKRNLTFSQKKKDTSRWRNEASVNNPSGPFHSKYDLLNLNESYAPWEKRILENVLDAINELEPKSVKQKVLEKLVDKLKIV